MSSLVLTFTAGLVHAYEVMPMRVLMAPSGEGRQAAVRITNNESKPVTVELSAQRRKVDEQGHNHLEPAPEAFIIFPPQAIVEPGATQVVRVQWAGAPELAHSQSYYLSVEQQPIELDPNNESSGLRMLMNFRVAVHVSPEEAKPSLDLAATKARDGGHLALTVDNNGRRYFYLNEARLLATKPSGERHVLEADALAEMVERTFLPPRGRRTFTVELPPAFIGDSVEYVFERSP